MLYLFYLFSVLCAFTACLEFFAKSFSHYQISAAYV